ncbi:hypothetical protein XapB_23840 (plasmid) [Xanthomonas citri pv. punicae]|nr:hypothetical protein XapB_23840 [Xanthomonas citri pv. punicae]
MPLAPQGWGKRWAKGGRAYRSQLVPGLSTGRSGARWASGGRAAPGPRRRHRRRPVKHPGQPQAGVQPTYV